ncbi:MAG: fumarylacetoacetate hydrolase family protein [Anaerolineae bacterium]|nr:fumarylacetoacetate hydrolase family protein [Anaerolineae bacterium]
MQIVRYKIKSSQVRNGWLHNGLIGEISGSIWGDFERGEAEIDLEKAKLLAPVEPGKIICVGRNYAAHAEEHDAEVPEVPLIFLKPPSAVIGPGDDILLPPQSKQVEHEAELAVVIGKQGKWIPAEKVGEHILGYTIANDVSARDLQRGDGQWTRGKGFDTFCPLGPWIETDFDASDALISCHVNDEMRQMASTRDMVFSIRQLIAFVSSVMTLNPGDILLTGTPSGVGKLEAGDNVHIEIEGIGRLSNPVDSGRGRERS